MRASGDVHVISVKTRPAPPSARCPRWTRWKSVTSPSSAEYIDIGETTTRLTSSTPRTRKGTNMGGEGGEESRRGGVEAVSLSASPPLLLSPLLSWAAHHRS